MTFYVQPHISQYDYSAYTAQNGCTWTAGANGIGATSGGRYHPNPDYLHSLVDKSEETNPFTAGWSIPDLRLACSRYGMSLVDRSGKGWDDVIAQLLEGHYCVVQGVSAQFPNTTCSGEFNGGHAIGTNPKHRQHNGRRQWWIDDGICADGRWEDEDVLKRYAQALNFGIQYGAFLGRVPQVDVEPVNTAGGNVTIRYAAVAATSNVMQLADGQRLYDRPGGKPITRMSRKAAVPHVGLAGQVNGKAWRAVMVATGVGYTDGKPHRTVLYVPSSAGKVVAA